MAGKTAIVSMGKYGDILNILPLAQKLSQEKGYPIGFVVAERFKSVLEAVSYVTPIIYKGDFTEIPQGVTLAHRMGYRDIIITQIYGHGRTHVNHCSSFCLDAWDCAGRLADYGAPLVLDKRDEVKADALKQRLLPKSGKPIILLAAHGESAPFPYKEQVVDALWNTFGCKINIVDLDEYKDVPFMDIRYLYEHAACIIAVDTGFLHLASAFPDLPCCALISYKPSDWHGTPKRDNHIFWCRYNTFPIQLPEMLKAIRLALIDRLIPIVTQKLEPEKNTLWRVTSSNPNPDAATAKRLEVAEQSWQIEALNQPLLHSIRVTDDMVKRNALSVGDSSPLPFVHDMVELAAAQANDEDVIVLCNADIGIIPGTCDSLIGQCRKNGATWTHRWDFKKLGAPLSATQEVQRGKWYPGIDLFAFTKAWWNLHKDELPDYILGRESWDWVMRELIKKYGGDQVHAVAYHEIHGSLWKEPGHRAMNVGNQYNRGYSRKWLAMHRIPLRELTHAPYLQVEWPKGSAVLEAPKPSGTDVVIVLGTGSVWDNMELRFCLRSIERHVTDLRKVFVVGHNPGFLSPDVVMVPFKDPGHNKEHNITAALEYICHREDLTEEFVFFNDDHFLLAPTTLKDYPYYHKGMLEAGIQAATAGGYTQSLRNTMVELRKVAMTDINYEMHVPIRYNKHKFLMLKDWWDKSALIKNGLLPRSIYCNSFNVTGTQWVDSKMREPGGKENVAKGVEGRHVFSIADSAISTGAADFLFEMYPRKSRFER